jgi:phosphonate degradation associated HDIG domain protein
MTTGELLSIYEGRGAEAYFGEAVSVIEHSLQAAHLAQCSQAPDRLVVAALLHDIGHLIKSVPGDITDWKADARHELTGGRWLASRFGPDVFEPVRLHVLAKRYLCATDAAYLGVLSAASVVTLNLQGGSMSRAEADAFEAEPYFREAILLRRWDDQAKVTGLSVPGFADYGPLIERLAATSA